MKFNSGFLAIAIIILFGIAPGSADYYYAISDNEIISNDFKIVLTEPIISEILIDNNSIYFFTSTNLYSANKTTGTLYYKVQVKDIKEMSQSDNNIFVKKSFEILTIDKDTGEILSKHFFNALIDKIYSLTTSTLSTFYVNVLGQPQLDSVTLIPGQNIALSQDTANKTITITGAATWTLSKIDANHINTTEIRNIAGTDVTGIDILANALSIWNDIGNSFLNFDGYKIWLFYNGTSFFMDSTLAQIDSDEITLNGGEINLNGNVNINNKNLEQELVKISIKSFQADYLNTSQIYSDLILVPQDISLTNITVIIDNSVNTTNYTLNFSLNRFTNYPTSKETIFEGAFNSSTNYINDLDYSFNNNDILLLNYTSYVNVSKSSSLFKFKVR